jgi:predicted transcriptional regulator
MTREQIRQATAQIVDALPDEATWDDLMYRVYARQRIEEGLADSTADRVFTVEEARAHFRSRS